MAKNNIENLKNQITEVGTELFLNGHEEIGQKLLVLGAKKKRESKQVGVAVKEPEMTDAERAELLKFLEEDDVAEPKNTEQFEKEEAERQKKIQELLKKVYHKKDRRNALNRQFEEAGKNSVEQIKALEEMLEQKRAEKEKKRQKLLSRLSPKERAELEKARQQSESRVKPIIEEKEKQDKLEKEEAELKEKKKELEKQLRRPSKKPGSKSFLEYEVGPEVVDEVADSVDIKTEKPKPAKKKKEFTGEIKVPSTLGPVIFRLNLTKKPDGNLRIYHGGHALFFQNMPDSQVGLTSQELIDVFRIDEFHKNFLRALVKESQENKPEGGLFHTKVYSKRYPKESKVVRLTLKKALLKFLEEKRSDVFKAIVEKHGDKGELKKLLSEANTYIHGLVRLANLIETEGFVVECYIK